MFYFSLADEREDVQKKTFTKWINAQFAKVIKYFFICKPNYVLYIKKKKKFLPWGLIFKRTVTRFRYCWMQMDDLLEKKITNLIPLISVGIEMQEAIIFWKCSLPQFTLPFLKLVMQMYYCLVDSFAIFLIYKGVSSVGLVLFLTAMTNLTKLDELERSKVTWPS